MKWYYLVGLTVVVMMSTLLVRIPLPGKGYFNFGDVVVVFAGLYGGKKAGFVAGAFGSAFADLIGFPLFAPITFVAKGLEGLICGFGKGLHGWKVYSITSLGVLAMVAVYFFGSALLPQIGLPGAIAELPANLIQAGLAVVGGNLVFQAFDKYSNRII
ncbi:MAG: hypothetical protein CVU48_06665 [Candidatus Cloacimonetes bacterium HGW-Cloacimonetes-1]|nr:MAG: hypothetical protein CVU48_06665 [Candidatus Cloacimonetes bacterium HGW-Cloacimonetes-1]